MLPTAEELSFAFPQCALRQESCLSCPCDFAVGLALALALALAWQGLRGSARASLHRASYLALAVPPRGLR